MILLRPITITGVTATGGTPDANHPAGNLLQAAPAEYLAQTLTGAVMSTTIEATITGTVDSLVLVGVESSATPVVLRNGSGAAIAGSSVTELADPYTANRRNVWIAFPAQTGAGLKFRIIISKASSLVDEIVRARVLLAGTTETHTGLLFPLGEQGEDPTPEITMADGSPQRAVQLPVRRVFSGTMRAARTAVDAFCDAIRADGARPTAVHFEPTWAARYFAYGRMTTQPGKSHDYPTLSLANFEFREWV